MAESTLWIIALILVFFVDVIRVQPNSGVFIPELGLVYTRGILTNPGAVSSQASSFVQPGHFVANVQTGQANLRSRQRNSNILNNVRPTHQQIHVLSNTLPLQPTSNTLDSVQMKINKLNRLLAQHSHQNIKQNQVAIPNNVNRLLTSQNAPNAAQQPRNMQRNRQTFPAVNTQFKPVNQQGQINLNAGALGNSNLGNTVGIPSSLLSRTPNIYSKVPNTGQNAVVYPQQTQLSNPPTNRLFSNRPNSLAKSYQRMRLNQQSWRNRPGNQANYYFNRNSLPLPLQRQNQQVLIPQRPTMWDQFRRSGIFIIPQQLSTVAGSNAHTTSTTTPTPKPSTTTEDFYSLYDWAWMDPYPAVTESITTTQSSLQQTLKPSAIPIGSSSPRNILTTSVNGSRDFLNTSDSIISTSLPAISDNTTLSARERAAFMQSILKPPYNPKYYELICKHENKTNPNRSSHAFGPVNSDCGMYVKCNVWSGYFFPNETRCPLGLWFDSGLAMCVDADAISKPCLYNPCNKLRAGNQLNVPYPGSCNWFLACEGGSATAEMCDTGVNFDVTTGMCCVPPAICPCFDSSSGVTPDYEFMTFLRNLPQMNIALPAKEKSMEPIHTPLTLNVQHTDLCLEIQCSPPMVWDSLSCQCVLP